MTFRHRGTVALAALLLSRVALHAQPSAARPSAGRRGRPTTPPTPSGRTPNGTRASGAANAAPTSPRAASPTAPGGASPNRNTATPATPGTQTGAPAAAGQTAPTRTGQQPENGAVEPQQREVLDTVRRQLERRNLRPATNIGVTVETGVTLPSRVQVHELPPEIARVGPQYRDYGFVVTEKETVIVDPRTRRVVEVIQRDELRQRSAQAQGGAGRAPQGQARAPETTGSLGLTEDDRIDIARTLLRRSEPGSLVSIRELRGAVLPETLDLQRLPRSLTERTPELREFSYVLMGDDVLLVEPDTRRVVDVLR